MAASEGPSPVDDASLKCSFCGKTRAEVAMLVQGPSALICDECVHLSAAIVMEARKPPTASPPREATCAVHGERRAIFVCVRCGAFGCEACAPVDHRAVGVCARCRPLAAGPGPQSRSGALVLGALLGAAAIFGAFVLGTVISR